MNRVSNFFKNYPMFTVVSGLTSLIISFAFAISFIAIKEVAIEIGIAIPLLYPFLFEFSSLTGGMLKMYLELNDIHDKTASAFSNAMLWGGAFMAVGFNVYHSLPLIEANFEGGLWLPGVVMVLGHALAPATVIGGAEVLIKLGKHTFAKKREGELDRALDRLEAVSNDLEKTSGDLQNTQRELALVTKENKQQQKDLNELTKQLKKFEKMPEMYYDLYLTITEQRDKEWFAEKYPTISVNRLTGWQNKINELGV